MPETIGEGLLLGLMRPLFGMDHLSFLLLAGLIVFTVTRRSYDARLVLGLSLVGCLAQMYFGQLPAVDLLVACSVVLMLLVLWIRSKLAPWSTLILSLGAVCHGYAYGAELSEPTVPVLVAYLLGLTLVQATVLYGFGPLCAYLARKDPSALETIENIVSAVGSGVGLVYIVRAL